MHQYLNQTSIRARFAIGLTCLKLLMRERGLLYQEFSRNFLQQLGKFTQYEDLGIWDREHRFYFYENSSVTVTETVNMLRELQDAIQFENYALTRQKMSSPPIEILPTEFYQSMEEFYSAAENKELISILSLLSKLTTIELYVEMSKNNSQLTLQIVEDILRQTEFQHEFNFKKIALQYPFHCKKDFGWGAPFRFKDFKRI